MSTVESPSDEGTVPKRQLTAKYVRWGGLGALLGPFLVLTANLYGLWETQTYGGAVEGVLEAGTTTPHVVFGGIRLLGGLLLVFGLIAIYAYQVEAAGRLGIVGFVVSIIGTVLLAGQAWFIAFFEPALVSEAPGFVENVMGGQTGGPLVTAGLMVPIFTQAIGWTIFGIATYRAGVFPRLPAIVLTVGALLLFIPIEGIPIVFQVGVAWLGFLVFTGRVESRYQDTSTETPSPGEPS
jgi:hypothetical protein